MSCRPTNAANTRLSGRASVHPEPARKISPGLEMLANSVSNYRTILGFRKAIQFQAAQNWPAYWRAICEMQKHPSRDHQARFHKARKAIIADLWRFLGFNDSEIQQGAPDVAHLKPADARLKKSVWKVAAGSVSGLSIGKHKVEIFRTPAEMAELCELLPEEILFALFSTEGDVLYPNDYARDDIPDGDWQAYGMERIVAALQQFHHRDEVIQAMNAIARDEWPSFQSAWDEYHSVPYDHDQYVHLMDARDQLLYRFAKLWGIYDYCNSIENRLFHMINDCIPRPESHAELGSSQEITTQLFMPRLLGEPGDLLASLFTPQGLVRVYHLPDVTA